MRSFIGLYTAPADTASANENSGTTFDQWAPNLSGENNQFYSTSELSSVLVTKVKRKKLKIKNIKLK